MNTNHIKIIASELNLHTRQVENTIKLLDEGATIPFISRYRKEATGSLDEVQISEIKNKLAKLIEFDDRKETIINSIEKQEKLTPELKAQIEAASTITELEDIYLPYKPKKKTRASVAREKGLEPLAEIIFKQKEKNIKGVATNFITEQVENTEEAIQGASDIIAEWVNEDIKARNIIRNVFDYEAHIVSRVVKGKDEDGEKYKDYFDFSEPLKKCPSHRLLAMRRGEEEGILKVAIAPSEEKAIEKLNRLYINSKTECSAIVENAVKDSYKRLMGPSIETEFAQISKEIADNEAIKVFVENLKQLLLSAPLGEKRVLALDPGYRTGCKLVCLDAQGNLLHNEAIYPHPPQSEIKMAAKKIESLVNAYKIDAIAIGNGTASRETEFFIKKSVTLPSDTQMFIVNESGASIYSASSIAREEFPDYDVTVRGAVSIGRRLMDPLAELVKIDPKSIGVGQYQHDVDQKKLQTSLDTVVESCVNNVGVDLNTASKHLLTYVSGLGPQLAQNIVDFRKENGPFKSRKELKKVKRLGDKAFEQCAGFLRIRNSSNPLDNSAIHPESYHIVEKMAKDLSCEVKELLANQELRKKIKVKDYVSDDIGLPTLTDIVQELEKPGRDPRSKIKVFEFADIKSIDELTQGMVVPGIVNNITNFGAFVDIGIKENGLLHVSEMADKFISNPNDIVSLHQHVKVKIVEVDAKRKRISLSLKGL